MTTTKWSLELGDLLTACAIALALGLASPARATAILTVSDGTNTWTQQGDGTAPITVTAPTGLWTATGFTKPLVSDPFDPFMDLSIAGFTSGNLTITFTDSDFKGDGSLDFQTGSGGTLCESPPFCNRTDGTLSIASATTLGNLSTLGAFGDGAFSDSSVAAGTLPGTFGLSLVAQVSSEAPAQWSADSFVTEVPEPGSLALFAVGLAGCVVLVRRRRATHSTAT